MDIKNEVRQEGNIRYHIITDNIWHIEDENNVFCTLVIGKNKAILFDTGFGNIGIKPFVERHISTELMVINSHGHPDHIGGNDAFETIYASSKEMDLVFFNWSNFKKTQVEFMMRDIEPGVYIDLGDEKAEVVSLSGHSAGSIGLLLHNSGILLAADALNENLWLFNPGTMNIATWRKNVKNVFGKEFTYYLTGHSSKLYSKSRIKDILSVSEEIDVNKSRMINILGQDVLLYEDNEKGVSITYDERVLAEESILEIPAISAKKKQEEKSEKKGFLRKLFK